MSEDRPSPTARGAAGALGGVPAALQELSERELEQLIFDLEARLNNARRHLGRKRRKR
jgi:hypothetical protein